MTFNPVKWTCEYCTYENYPNALKCTMCRGPKPLLGEDIYRLRDENVATGQSSGVEVSTNESNYGKWSCEACTFFNQPWCKECVQCRTSRHTPQVTASNLHEQLKPLKISESSETTNVVSCTAPPPPPPTTTSSKQFKWSCGVCTYENWPKAKKCTMCGSLPPVSTSHRVSPSHSSNSVKASPERDSNKASRGTSNEDNLYNLKRSNSSRDGLASATNNYEYERRKRQADWVWLNACLGVLTGDITPVEAFLKSGGSPTRALTASEVSLLNRPSAFDVGLTLVHLAIRFRREEMLGTLVTELETGQTGLKRVPSYVAPDLAKGIRHHAATMFTMSKHSTSMPCPHVTEFNTFMLPAEIDDLPAHIQDVLFEELLDKDVQQVLEAEPPIINWSIEMTVHLGSRLYALWNRSQGDCLLDSLMQATWAVFDRDNFLRSALADALTHSGHLFYPRWKEYETWLARELDFSLSESQWAEDWGAILVRATQPGASLQQLHIFVLAHILRRPIIVYGVRTVKSFKGEEIGYAGFEGVYLPLLWEPAFCTTSPVCLGYTRGHFSALVAIEPYPPSSHNISSSADDNLQVVFLPLVGYDRKLLPVHFITKSEMGSEERLLRHWLDVNVTEKGLLVAQQRAQKRPLLLAQMIEEWLNHYRRLAQMSSMPYNRKIQAPGTAQDFSSDNDSDDE